MRKQKFLDNLQKYRFEFKHITVLFIVLISFQIILSFIQKRSLQNFLDNTQKWYQQDSAEKIANLAATSMEMLLENIDVRQIDSDYEKRKIIQSFNIIFSQQLLQKNIEDICLIVQSEDRTVTIDDGKALFNYLHRGELSEATMNNLHSAAIKQLNKIKDEIRLNERIYSVIEGHQTFHVFVPFVPNGDFQGVLYMRKTPDFRNMTGEIITSYEESAIIYSSLILLGLLAMYYISSYTVKERNDAQKLLFEENEKHLKEKIMHEKESLFTKRIYHTHHKAEKVMGFIKEDTRKINKGAENIEEITNRVIKYSNFISRVIYDMKWYDPPLHTIRGMMFSTNLNELIKFLVNNIFLRISSATNIFQFDLKLEENVPPVSINEFVAWEVLEPLIQNSIDHADVKNITITISTSYDQSAGETRIIISDNGKGIPDYLLEPDENGVKNIFSENISTKTLENQNSGYGCYIAYEMAVKKCGWKLDAQNNAESGASFIITIKN
jgi:signal transduction histidine kinase